jgi:hypothetical protein
MKPVTGGAGFAKVHHVAALVQGMSETFNAQLDILSLRQRRARKLTERIGIAVFALGLVSLADLVLEMLHLAGVT